MTIRGGRAHPGVLAAAAAALAAASLLLPSTPTYDPWAWIVWGREIAALDLDTRYGPSWKPLPVLLTTPFSLAGDAAPALWLVVARAGALLAVAMAFRLARRLVGGRAGLLAGATAAVALAVSPGWLADGALGNSEGLLVAFALLAVERHLDGRPRQALALGTAAALLRPEAWSLLGVYGAVLWVRRPELRRGVALAFASIPLLWLLPELWGSGEPLRAAERAREVNPGSPALAGRPALAVLDKWVTIVPPPALAGTAIAVAWALARRRPAVVALAAGGAVWLLTVAAMTEAGWSGNPRYLAVPVAVACLLGGAGAGVAVRGLSLLAPGPRPLAVAARSAGAVAVGVAVAATLLGDVRRVDDAARVVDFEAELNEDLAAAVELAGGPGRVLACGRPVTGPYQVPALAWELGVHTRIVDHEPQRPGALFRVRMHPRARFVPALTSTAGWARVGEVGGTWELLAACRDGAALAAVGPR